MGKKRALNIIKELLDHPRYGNWVEIELLKLLEKRNDRGMVKADQFQGLSICDLINRHPKGDTVVFRRAKNLTPEEGPSDEPYEEVVVNNPVNLPDDALTAIFEASRKLINKCQRELNKEDEAAGIRVPKFKYANQGVEEVVKDGKVENVPTGQEAEKYHCFNCGKALDIPEIWGRYGKNYCLPCFDNKEQKMRP